MFSLLRKAIDIRRGEAGRTWIMFSHIFLVLASYLILKSMTRSLFLTNLGATQLPFVYMLVAIVVGSVAVIYARLAANIRLDRLMIGTTIFLMANLVLFWWFLTIDVKSALLYYGLWVWTSIFGILTTSQFWLLANYVFNPREAKRLFPFLVVGAMLGGITGGFFTRALVKQIGGTANLAFFCIGFLGTTILLINLAWRRREKSFESTRSVPGTSVDEKFFQVLKEVFILIRNSRHLALLMGIVALIVMVSQIADFQFSAYASEEITGTADDLTQFFLLWFANLGVFSLVFQVLFAGAIIRRFGVGVTVFFLPLAMMVTSMWVFVGYGLISILAIKIGDGAFRHSINKAGIELLFLPIPPEVKKKTKTFVDMFADRLARGISGFLLLIFYSWFGLSVSQISLVSLFLIGIWMVLAFANYREYVESFRQALNKRRIDADLLTVSIKDVATINSLIVALASRNERQVVYSLQLLESVEGVDLVPPIRPLLQHSSAEVRLRSLQLLGKCSESELFPEVKELLHDSEEDVRREAVRYYIKFSTESASEMLIKWLQDEDSGLRGSALYCTAEQPEVAAQLLTQDLINSFLSRNQEDRAQVAEALGILKRTEYHHLLAELIEDRDPSVRMRAITSAGRIRAKEFIPLLIRHMGDRIDRSVAREALAAYRDDIVGTLSDYLNDASVPIFVRREIPKVLSLIGSQTSVEVLLDSLPQSDEILKFQIIKSLSKLRTRYPDLHFDQRVDEALIQEIRKYYLLLAMLHSADGDKARLDRGTNLLQRALCERLDDHLERIFRLLGLRYPPRDIYNAYTATISTNKAIRSSAVEFLDNLLSKNFKHLLIPLVEEMPVEQVLQHADGVLDMPLNNRKEALLSLVSINDPWLRACALYEIGRCGLLDDFRHLVKQAQADQDTIVQETASVVLKRYSYNEELNKQ
ncbi:MAG: Npt1/Npt2 family nucleotide transporter [bacterium]